MNRGASEIELDKARRDAARASVRADVDLLRSNLKAAGLTVRAGRRIKEGMEEAAEESVEFAKRNPAPIAALAAGLGGAALWLARAPISALIDRFTNQTGSSVKEDEDVVPEVLMENSHVD